MERGVMSQEAADGPETDEPISSRTKVVAAVVVALMLAGAAYVMVRVSSPPIRPSQRPPTSHYSGSCEWCHTRSPDASPIEVQ
jgi:hypothetical protein